LRTFLPAIVCGLLVLPAPAQDAPESVPMDQLLSAEVEAVRPMFSPAGPVRIRFTLINLTPDVVEVPVDRPLTHKTGVALPPAFVLGTPEQPLVTIVPEGRDARLVTPPDLGPPPERGQRFLRIGPHGTVGIEIDLLPLHEDLRYPDVYRVEWRPFGGALEVASASFRVEPRMQAIIVTDYGKMTFDLAYDEAPLNVANFLDLVRSGFYDDKSFHRIVPGFLVQGGCPKGDGTGIRPDGQMVRAELCDAPFELGTLAMARKPSDPHSASCQFFITLTRLPALDGEYTIIGQASDEESYRTLMKLQSVDTNRENQPTAPVTIRSINLVDADPDRVRRLSKPEPGPEIGANAGVEPRVRRIDTER
jgi:peptidyl-prolyl cis-trans isomerase B (cyclophilin B)